MDNFSLCSCGANTRFFILFLAALINLVAAGLMINVFADPDLASKVDLANQILEIVGQGRAAGLYLCGGVALIVGATPVLAAARALSLKSFFLAGFGLMGVGLALQSLADSSLLLAAAGYVLVHASNVFPCVAMAAIVKDWFLESEQLLALGVMRVGRVAGLAAAFLGTFYVFRISELNLNSNAIIEKYSLLLKIYLAILFSTVCIIIVCLKSNPEGLEVTKKQDTTGSLLRRSQGQDQEIHINQHMEEEKADESRVELGRISSWSQLKLILDDSYLLLYLGGIIAPLAITSASEGLVLKYLHAFKFDSVETAK